MEKSCKSHRTGWHCGVCRTSGSASESTQNKVEEKYKNKMLDKDQCNNKLNTRRIKMDSVSQRKEKEAVTKETDSDSETAEKGDQIINEI